MKNPIAKFGNRQDRIDESGLNDPIYIEDLESPDNDPFHENNARPHSWLITTCVAGVAGSFVIGAAVLGLFSENGPSPARASVHLTERWQRPTVAAKTDLNGSVAKSGELRAINEVAVAYQVGLNPKQSNSSTILPQNGAVARDLFGFDPLGSPQTADQPTVLDKTNGNGQLAAISPGNTTTILKKLPPEPVDETIVLKKGDDLISRLTGLGVTRETATQLAHALEPVYPAKLLKAGQKFIVTLDKQQDFFGNFVIYPVELTFSPGPKESISVESNADGKFFASVNGQKKRQPSRYAKGRSNQFRIAGRITSSLFAAAVDKGVPEYITNQVIRAFSHDVDFQRDVKAGAKFEIYFGKPLSGSSKRRNVVHFASLEVRGKMKSLYRFTDSRGKTSYYDARGRGATKFLMRTPINGARISSGFGMRRHPVLGYSKMHTGVDFAAPRGTPIRAAGSGKIVYRARKGGYGNVVEIKHPNGYLTRYAHMSRFSAGLRVGSRVNQGRVIGYVGSTGRATGAHLHYEVRIGKRAVNPRRVRIAGKARLQGKDMALFKRYRRKIVAMMKKSPRVDRLASVVDR